MSDDGDALNHDAVRDQLLPPSRHFDENLRLRAVEEFGSDGAWLLLSLLWYGWRSYYDLASSVWTGSGPHDDDSGRPGALQHDFQIVRDLQVQGLLFAAGEVLAGLVVAADAHRRGTDRFLQAYGSRADVGSLVERSSVVRQERLAELLGAPKSVAELRADLPDEGPTQPDLDLATMASVEVGSLYIPKSAFDRTYHEYLFDRCIEVVELIHDNLKQLRQLTCAPDAGTADALPRPLRHVDNAFRHGHKVLFHDAVPEERRFQILGPPMMSGAFGVDLFMPGGDDRVRFAGIDASPARTLEHLESLRQVSVRIGQFLRGFLGWRVLRTHALLISAAGVELPAVATP